MEDLLPPDDGERAADVAAYAALPGLDEPVGLEELVCPEPGCGYTFPLFEVGEDAGRCPRHDVVLVPGG